MNALEEYLYDRIDQICDFLLKALCRKLPKRSLLVLLYSIQQVQAPVSICQPVDTKRGCDRKGSVQSKAQGEKLHFFMGFSHGLRTHDRKTWVKNGCFSANAIRKKLSILKLALDTHQTLGNLFLNR